METRELMQQISISEFKATCLAVLDQVRRTGRPILVTRRGVPIATVMPPPLPAKPQSWLGCMAGRIKIVGDVVSPAAEEGAWEALLP